MKILDKATYLDEELHDLKLRFELLGTGNYSPLVEEGMSARQFCFLSSHLIFVLNRGRPKSVLRNKSVGYSAK